MGGGLHLRENAMAIRSTRPPSFVRDARAGNAWALSKRRMNGELSKPDLQAMLAEAAKNTAAQSDPAVEEFARAVGPLLKGKRH